MLKKNVFLFYSILIGFLILFISIFFINYNSKENIALRSLKNLSINLNQINESLGNAVNELTIDTKKTKSYLEKGVKDLNTLSIYISNINDVDSNIISLKNKLNTSVNSTLNLYDKCLYILNNPKEINTNSDIDIINNLKSECTNSYLNLNDYNINIEFSTKTNTFFENFIYYLNTIIKINRDSEFKNTQQREFIYKLESLSSKFDFLNEDLFIAIDKIREENRDLKVIIDDLYLKEETFDDIKFSSA